MTWKKKNNLTVWRDENSFDYTTFWWYIWVLAGAKIMRQLVLTPRFSYENFKSVVERCYFNPKGLILTTRLTLPNYLEFIPYSNSRGGNVPPYTAFPYQLKRVGREFSRKCGIGSHLKFMGAVPPACAVPSYLFLWQNAEQFLEHKLVNEAYCGFPGWYDSKPRDAKIPYSTVELSCLSNSQTTVKLTRLEFYSISHSDIYIKA